MTKIERGSEVMAGRHSAGNAGNIPRYLGHKVSKTYAVKMYATSGWLRAYVRERCSVT